MFELYQSKQSSRLGSLLLNKRVINSSQLEQALTYQLSHNIKLGESLIALGFIKASTLKLILSKQRLMRSLVAGLMIVASPFTTVMANESDNDIGLSKSSDFQVDKNQLNFDEQFNYRPVSDFSLGIKYKISDKSGIVFGLGNASPNTIILSGIYKNALVPQISIYSTEKKKKSGLNFMNSDDKNPRFDRYKDTTPLVYSLTLKGYSLFEQSDSKTKVFQLNRIKDLNNRNFELMFSVSKHF